MANFNSLIRKLQLALKQKGFIVSISYSQFYDSGKDCFKTLCTIKHNNKAILRSTNKVLIVKSLVQILENIKQLPQEQIEASVKEMKFEKEE